MKYGVRYIILLLTSALLFQACSSTRHLQEDEVLYIGTRSLKLKDAANPDQRVKLRKSPYVSESVMRALWVKPNGALLGTPFLRTVPVRLYFYNWFYTEQDSTFGRWMMENFGEPPVTMDRVNPEVRLDYMENYLFNRGYFGVSGEYQLKYKNRKKKKAWVKYTLYIPEPYRYREINVKDEKLPDHMRGSIRKYMSNSKIRTGAQFNLDDLAREKDQFWQYLQNEGYYYFRKDHFLIVADTTVGNREVTLEYRFIPDDSQSSYNKVLVDQVKVKIDGIAFENQEERKTGLPGGKVLRNQLVSEMIDIKPASFYSLENHKATIRNISGLGIFSDPVITHTPMASDSSRIITAIELRTTDLVNLGLNTNITLKNIGYIGPDMGMFFTRKNLFGGAENLTFSLNGYLDFPYGVYSEKVSRSAGFQVKSDLTTPVLSSPLPFVKNNSGLATRGISLSFEMNDRADLFRIAQWKATYGVNWIPRKTISHQLNLATLTYSNLLKSNPEFDDLLDRSSLMRSSYRNQFITGPSYTFRFNNSFDESKRLTTFYQVDLEGSGNLIHSIQSLAGRAGTDNQFLGVDYSQFLLVRSDFRLYYHIRQGRSNLVFRNNLGLGYAFGNSVSLPYSRQFFIGGSNSIRPATARVFGPGRYFELDEAALNQTGDIKIETNLEYRFKIYTVIHGALWSDFGNIWLLREDPDRPGTGIRWNNILKDSYLTSGVGIRADLSFIVLRADLGAITYAPIFPGGYRWIWEREYPLLGLVFGIGYPF